MKQGSAELIAWNKRSTKVMEEVVRAKFNQNPDLAEKLIATGDLRLVEGNNHDDNLYGIQLKRVPGARKKLLVDEDGCYILPSSVEELMVIPLSLAPSDVQELADMVKSINESVVEDRIQLPAVAYRYSPEKGIEIVAEA